MRRLWRTIPCPRTIFADCLLSLFGASRSPGLLRGRRLRQARRSGNGCGRPFSVAPCGRFTARGKMAGASPSFATLRPVASRPGANRSRLPPFVATKAARVAADPTKESDK